MTRRPERGGGSTNGGRFLWSRDPSVAARLPQDDGSRAGGKGRRRGHHGRDARATSGSFRGRGGGGGFFGGLAVEDRFENQDGFGLFGGGVLDEEGGAQARGGFGLGAGG